MDARPEEMSMTRGSGERRSNGTSAVVSVATDVMFVLEVLLYVARRSLIEQPGSGIVAMAALLMRTFEKG
jgi:hypothetical protein